MRPVAFEKKPASHGTLLDAVEQKNPAGHGALADEPDAQYEPVLHAVWAALLDSPVLSQ